MFKKSLFGKVFLLIIFAIFLVLTVFAYQAVNLQKKSILTNLESEAKSITSSVIYVNTDAMIVDNEISILDFTYDFVQVNKNIKSITISRKNGDDIYIKKNNWTLVEGKEKNKNISKDIESYEMIYSHDLEEDVFRFRNVINLSSVIWGTITVELSLNEYNRKIDRMYEQFLYLAISILLTSIFISYLIARMISTPIIKLNNLANEVSLGDLSKRSNIKSKDEIGRLANSFNKMVQNLEYSQEKLKKSHNELEQRVNERTKELKELNDTLEIRVKEEIGKQKEQEQILIQQSKLAAMGEMIGNIAHQWRQPLNALGLVMQNINFSYQMDELDDEFMEKSVKKVNLLTSTMSKTIDDFRNFFKPNKEKNNFSLDEKVIKSINLVESTFEHNNIKISHKNDEPVNVYGFDNEFSQTIINILNNAKDALIENSIKDAKVEIEVFKDKEFGKVIIKDNAGGIPNEIIDKVFNPYFTTKEEGKGTGIGLYMSKIIIEQNMNGKLEVINENDGAVFTISVPLSGEN